MVWNLFALQNLNKKNMGNKILVKVKAKRKKIKTKLMNFGSRFLGT